VLKARAMQQTFGAKSPPLRRGYQAKRRSPANDHTITVNNTTRQRRPAVEADMTGHRQDLL